jgi:NAD(P)-dependent dehydrogenase (short-subunit alcohol dehydrogenase family)
MTLDGRVAVVTGAAGLLGREHCQALADAGARVVVTDLEPDVCAAAAARLGPGHLACAADITDPAAVERLRDAALSRFGRIDVLVNNAALNERVERPDPGSGRFESLPLETFRRALDVNVTGAFLCCQILGGVLAARGAGAIVNIASTYAVVAPDQSLYRRPDGSQSFYKSAAYPVAKAAILGLTRYLAAYWGARGVRVNALSPGGVENGQEPGFVERYAARTPLARMARPGDYRGALVFLASDASAYMTGANLIVDGGFTAW